MIGPCQCQEAHTHERIVKEKETERSKNRDGGVLLMTLMEDIRSSFSDP